MKLLTLMTFISLFFISCQESALEEVKVKSLGKKSKGLNKSGITIEDILNGKFEFVSDVNIDQPTFTPPLSQERIEIYDGFMYLDAGDPSVGQELYYYSYSNKTTTFLGDLSPKLNDLSPGDGDLNIYNKEIKNNVVWMLAHTNARGLELLSFDLASFQFQWHESIDGNTSEIQFDTPLNPVNFKLNITDDRVYIQSFEGVNYDHDVYEISSGTFVDYDGAVGYQDLDEGLLYNGEFFDTRTIGPYFIARDPAGDILSIMNDGTTTNVTHTGLTSFTTSRSIPAISPNITLHNTFSYSGKDYILISANNDLTLRKPFIVNLDDGNYIQLDSSGLTVNIANNVYDAAFSQDTLVYSQYGNTLTETRLFSFDMSLYPGAATGAPTTALVDFKDVGGANSSYTYDINDLTQVGNWVCMNDYITNAGHGTRTNYCYDFINDRLILLHPKEFDYLISLSDIDTSDIGSLSAGITYDSEGYYSKALVRGNRLFILLTADNTANDYQLYEVTLDTNVYLRRLIDFFPEGMNGFAQANYKAFSLTSPDDRYLSISYMPSTVYFTKTYDLTTNTFHNYSNAEYFAVEDLITDNGFPTVRYADQDLLFGEYNRGGPGHLYIIKKANKKKIYKENLIIPPNVKVKRVGNNIYFNARLNNHIDSDEVIVQFDIINEAFTHASSTEYNDVRYMESLGNRLFFVAYHEGFSEYRLFEWNSLGDITKARYSPGMYSSPVIYNGLLYTRSLFDAKLVSIDSNGNVNDIDTTLGVAYNVFTHENHMATNVFESPLVRYKHYLFYSGFGDADAQVKRYNLQTGAFDFVQNGSNNLQGNIAIPKVLKSGKLVFTDSVNDERYDTSSVGVLAYIYNESLNNVSPQSTSDNYVTKSRELVYRNSFNELFIYNPNGQDHLVVADMTDGGNCRNVLDGGQSKIYVTPNKGVLVYSHDKAGAITNNTLCYYYNGKTINFADYGLGGKDLDIMLEYQDNDYFIIQTVDQVADGSSKYQMRLVRFNSFNDSVSFISSKGLDSTVPLAIEQVGEAVMFCFGLVGAYHPRLDETHALATDKLCDMRSVYDDPTEMKFYFAANNFQSLIGYEQYSYCYDPSGTCQSDKDTQVDTNSPFISSVSHLYVQAGTTTNITINGTNLAVVDSVEIGTLVCTPISQSDSEIQCSAPALVAGTYDIELIQGDVVYNDQYDLIYNPNATITGLNPTGFNAGDTVYISGTSFVPGLRVRIDADECTNVNLISDTEIACQIAVTLTGSHTLQVRNGDNFDVTDTIVAGADTAPVIDAIGDETVNENVAITQVNANDGGDDLDADGDTLTYSCQYDMTVSGSIVSGSPCTSLPGSPSFNTATGVFDWNPDYNSAGTYEIEITADEGDLSDTELFVITVNNVNRPPVLMNIADVNITQNTVENVNINANDMNTFNDFDIDGDPLMYSCYVDTTVDSFVGNTNDCGSFLPMGSFNFNTSTGQFDWTTPNNLSGINYEIRIEAQDGNGGMDDEIFVIAIP
jgi:hypothetical protein